MISFLFFPSVTIWILFPSGIISTPSLYHLAGASSSSTPISKTAVSPSTTFLPLGRGIVLLDTNLEDGSLALDHILALQLAGEGMLELLHLQFAAGGVLPLLGELAINLASPFACIRHLCLPDLQTA